MCWCTIWSNWLFSGNGSRVLSSFLITTSTNTYKITQHQNNNALSTKYGTWLHRIMEQPRFICTWSTMCSRDITLLRVCNKSEKYEVPFDILFGAPTQSLFTMIQYIKLSFFNVFYRLKLFTRTDYRLENYFSIVKKKVWIQLLFFWDNYVSIVHFNSWIKSCV